MATHQSGVFKSIFEIIESSSVNPLFEIINESLTNCDYLQISRTITTNPLVRQLSLERFVTDNFDAFDSPKSPTKDFLVWTAFWCDFLPYNVIKKGADWISTLKVKILGRDYLEYCTELRRIQQKIIAFDPRYEQFYSEWRHRWISWEKLILL